VSNTTNVMMGGVGGQGIILASEVLAEALMAAGLDVKKSEVHGMAQRGGSVRTDVRFGPKVWSPLISPGGADLLVAFEQLESLRYLPYLREGGTAFVSTQVIVPTTVVGGAGYPADVKERLGKRAKRVVMVDAPGLAAKAGNVRTAGIALLGAFAPLLPVPDEAWEVAFAAKIPGRFLEVNRKAFQLGREAGV